VNKTSYICFMDQDKLREQVRKATQWSLAKLAFTWGIDSNYFYKWYKYRKDVGPESKTLKKIKAGVKSLKE